MSEKELKSKSKSEAEIYEAATEESATVGCPSLVPWKRPGGFDGAAPGKEVKDKGEGEQRNSTVHLKPSPSPESAAKLLAPSSEQQREEARQKRKIHWASYTTKVDVTVMGKTGQSSKVYEVRVDKRREPGEYTCATCRVNGKRVMDVKFTGSAWMLKRILTAGMQGLVNYKALRCRNKRRREREIK